MEQSSEETKKASFIPMLTQKRPADKVIFFQPLLGKFIWLWLFVKVVHFVRGDVQERSRLTVGPWESSILRGFLGDRGIGESENARTAWDEEDEDEIRRLRYNESILAFWNPERVRILDLAPICDPII
ncbi:hypothetical protein C8J57DRAFT_1216745 [Mycena rebaudengoi]|nr:hypothetical protein C8J57DRAFT_1216745 [Mycena rebaudengoi]